MSDHPTIEQLSSLIDGQLSNASREAVIGHVRTCPTCAALQDRLIEVAAELQSRPPLTWSRSDTQNVLARIRAEQRSPARPRRERDWALPIAGALALVAVVALLLVAPGLPSAGVSSSGFDAISTLAPAAGLIPSGHFILALAVVAAMGIAAVPLLRRR